MSSGHDKKSAFLQTCKHHLTAQPQTVDKLDLKFDKS
jgi:hypothetical protein